MPLITFTSDLTNLPYGLDRPGAGYSGQPYIKTPIPGITPASTDPLATTFETLRKANSETLDFPIRGGKVGPTGLNGRLTTPAGEIDRARIQAFLDDKLRGPLFLLKQQGLQLTNPNIQVPQVGTSNTGDNVPITRVYSPNGETLLAQAAAQGTGLHVRRHGNTPVFVTPYDSTYESYVKKNNTAISNRLLVLYQTKIAVDSPFAIARAGISETLLQLRTRNIIGLATYAKRYDIPLDSNNLFEYDGGPGSVYGVGRTIIRRQEDTTQANEKATTLYNTFTFTYQQLLNQRTSDDIVTPFNPTPRQRVGAKIQDFRAQLATQTGLPGNFLTASYSDVTKWYNPAFTGNPGALETRRRINYSQVNEAKIDQLNNIGLYHYDPNKNPFNDTEVPKDIIKFGFECISNDRSDEAIALFFRAFLTSLADNHQAEYNSFKYLGRGETFRTYQGFDRSITFGFKIAAQTKSEMISLYSKLNHLISQIYPDYSPTSGFMRAPVVKLTIGDYMYRIPGFIESINLNLLNEAAWEIALDPGLGLGTDTGLDEDMNQLPQMIDVQCSFKPIHDFLPRREVLPLLKYGALPGQSPDRVPFIGWRAYDVEGGRSWLSIYGTDKYSPDVEEARAAAIVKEAEELEIANLPAVAKATTVTQQPTTQTTAVVKQLKKGKNLNAHSKACDDTASIIGSFASNTVLAVNGASQKSACNAKDTHDWWNVTGQGNDANGKAGTITGWVRGDFITVTTTTNPATGTTNADATTKVATLLKEKPCTTSDNTARVESGAIVVITATVGSDCGEPDDWYTVTLTDAAGVTYNGYLKKSEVELRAGYPAPPKAVATATNASQTNQQAAASGATAATQASAATVATGNGQQYYTARKFKIGQENSVYFFKTEIAVDFGIFEVTNQEPWHANLNQNVFYIVNTENSSIKGWLEYPNNGYLEPFYNGGPYIANSQSQYYNKVNNVYSDKALTLYGNPVLAGTKLKWINVSSKGSIGNYYDVVIHLQVTEVPPTTETNIAAVNDIIYAEASAIGFYFIKI